MSYIETSEEYSEEAYSYSYEYDVSTNECVEEIGKTIKKDKPSLVFSPKIQAKFEYNSDATRKKKFRDIVKSKFNELFGLDLNYIKGKPLYLKDSRRKVFVDIDIDSKGTARINENGIEGSTYDHSTEIQKCLDNHEIYIYVQMSGEGKTQIYTPHIIIIHGKSFTKNESEAVLKFLQSKSIIKPNESEQLNEGFMINPSSIKSEPLETKINRSKNKASSSIKVQTRDITLHLNGMEQRISNQISTFYDSTFKQLNQIIQEFKSYVETSNKQIETLIRMNHELQDKLSNLNMDSNKGLTESEIKTVRLTVQNEIEKYKTRVPKPAELNDDEYLLIMRHIVKCSPELNKEDPIYNFIERAIVDKFLDIKDRKINKSILKNYMITQYDAKIPLNKNLDTYYELYRIRTKRNTQGICYLVIDI